MRTQEEIKRMTYKELENAVIKVDCYIRTMNDRGKKQQLINEAHDMRMEMDRRWGKWEKRCLEELGQKKH